MKTRMLLVASLLLVHCNGEETLSPPKITIDLSPVWVGERSVAEEAPGKEFNLLVQNEGEEKLIISSAKLKGDQNCAFTKEGPDKKELGGNDSAFIRLVYKPTVRGEDNVKLIIQSNSEEFPRLVVPICGRGLLPEEITVDTDTEDTDNEDTDNAENNDEDHICNAPPDDQPDCESAVDTESE
jgi:hypothetical protein